MGVRKSIEQSSFFSSQIDINPSIAHYFKTDNRSKSNKKNVKICNYQLYAFVNQAVKPKTYLDTVERKITNPLLIPNHQSGSTHLKPHFSFVH